MTVRSLTSRPLRTADDELLVVAVPVIAAAVGAILIGLSVSGSR